MNLDEDFHVHSTFSDGASTLAENVYQARDRGLRTLCLVDHVRRDTTWVADFTQAVDQFRRQPGPRILAGVEAKILDTSGQLDVPPDLAKQEGLDLILIADHQFPCDHGPIHPDKVNLTIAQGAMTPAEALEALCEATANSLRAPVLDAGFRPLLAHLFSILPKIGLDEAMVPDSLLTHLAKRVAHAGAMVEINEKWSCPSARTVTAMAGAGVELVTGSDSHHRRDVGVYDSVRRTVTEAGRLTLWSMTCCRAAIGFWSSWWRSAPSPCSRGAGSSCWWPSISGVTTTATARRSSRAPRS